ncbi:MAG: sigma-E factor regulatory protein RseB domain-containing protein, partial [Burkholderiales bacterium]
MRALVLAAALAAGSVACPGGAAAQANADAISWLQRIYRSTERLSYTGTFVYQHGDQVESSRITRIVDASGVHERLETLDGTPREIVRVNEEVK